MATPVIAEQQRRGTTAEHAAFTGLVGELTVDTDKETAVIHDGATAGGFPLIRQDKVSNPNILINSNGLDPINQRDVDIATGEVVTNGTIGIDRWKMVHNVTTATLKQETGIRLTATTKGAGNAIYFEQVTEGFASFASKTLTFSARVKSNIACILRVGDGVGLSDSTAHSGGGGFETLTATLSVDASPTIIYTEILGTVLADGNYIEFEWIKLEEGPVATAYVLPDPAEELARCQRYGIELTKADVYSTVGYGYATGTTNVRAYIPIPVTMRTTPTITTSGNFGVGSTSITAASAIAISGTVQGDNMVSVDVTSTGLTAGSPYSLLANNDATASLFLNAEL